MKQVSFEELPQILQDRVTRWTGLTDEQHEVIRCDLNRQGDARCYIKSDTVIGIFYKDMDRVGCIWLNEIDLRFLYGSLNSSTASAMGKKGGSAKTEAKSSASRENGKKGGRPKKIKPE